MIFKKLSIKDSYLIKPVKNYDLRGAFFRTFCEKEINQSFFKFKIKQCNISYNKNKFTFRGLHYSSNIHKENKIIMVANGSIENYMIDLRRNSKKYLKKLKIRLN